MTKTVIFYQSGPILYEDPKDISTGAGYAANVLKEAAGTIVSQ